MHTNNYNVRDYGAVPGDRTGIDNVLARILSAVLDSGVPSTLHFPPDVRPYFVAQPWFLTYPGLEIRGGGTLTSTIESTGPFPVFVAGFEPARTRREDLHGWLEEMAIPRKAQRLGIGQHVIFPFSLPSSPKLTWDWFDVGLVPGFVFGVPGSWEFVLDSKDCYKFAWWHEGAKHETGFSLAQAGFVGSNRIAFQLDLESGRTAAYTNGIQVNTVGPSVGGLDEPTGWLEVNPSGLLGPVKISATHRYLDQGPGMPLARTDKRPVTDYGRYFDAGEADTLFVLPLTDGDYLTNAVVEGYKPAYGFTPSPLRVSDVRLRDVTLRSEGVALVLGECDRFRAQDVYFAGGVSAIREAAGLRFRDCVFDGQFTGEPDAVTFSDCDFPRDEKNGDLVG